MMNHKGFSLIELMIVVAILAILASIGARVFVGGYRIAETRNSYVIENNEMLKS